MKVGMIARGDDGGLGTMTREFHRHIRPDFTVLMDIPEANRGVCRPERYPYGTTSINPGPHLLDEQMNWLLRQCDVVYTAETAYRDDFWFEANRAGVATVLHAMPELYSCPQDDRPTIVAVPTEWELERMPFDTVVLPVPVALDRLTFNPRSKAVRFMHQAAPAMLDRNGTRTVVNCLPYVTEQIELVMRGVEQQRLPRHTNVRVTWEPDARTEYWEGYDQVDVLLLPRRYAGLSLPVQEAMASGCPIVMTDVAPNDFYTERRIAVRPDKATTAQMKGGWFSVYDGDPVGLADQINELARKPELVRQLSLRSGLFGRTHSWERLGPRYLRVLMEAAKRSVRR